MSFTTIMVHVDVERDSEQRVQLALALADRFQAALIGVASLAIRPAFAAEGLVIYRQPTEHEHLAARARLDDMGERFRAQGQHLKQVEWRTALELPYELVSREARAADLIIVGARHTAHSVRDLIDPGVIMLRAGRPVLVVPDTVAPLQLRRLVVAWKDTRECRRAVRDAIAFLHRLNRFCWSASPKASRTPEPKGRFPTSQDTFSATESPRRTGSGGKHGGRSPTNCCASFRTRGLI
jgi:nucleotide-binding universal stress UspA family protein